MNMFALNNKIISLLSLRSRLPQAATRYSLRRLAFSSLATLYFLPSGYALELQEIRKTETFNQSENGQVLPQKTAIVGKVILDIVLDPDRKYNMPVTMVTALPTYDEDGNVALPSGTLITALIQKKDGGDYITADSLVYRGINLRINSVGHLIPAQVKPENYGVFTAPPQSKASSVASSIDASVIMPTLLAIALSQTYVTNEKGQQSQNLTPLVLGVVGIDAGVKMLAALLDRSPKRLPPLVEIPRDTLIVFTLNEKTNLPNSKAPETKLQIQEYTQY